MRGQWGCRSIALVIHNLSAEEFEGGQCHNLAALPWERDPAPIFQDACWASGPVWTGKDNFTAAGVGTPDRPARSESLSLLSHPGRLYSIRLRFCIFGF
jgi:hypothetical protein